MQVYIPSRTFMSNVLCSFFIPPQDNEQDVILLFIYNTKNIANGKYTQYLHFVANFELEQNAFTVQLANSLVPIYCSEVHYNANEIEYNQIPAYFNLTSEELELLSSPMPSQAMHTFALTLRLIHVIVTLIESSGETMKKNHKFLQLIKNVFFHSELPPRARYSACLVSMMRVIDNEGLQGGFASGIRAFGEASTDKEAKMCFEQWSEVIRTHSG
jgi:hypothetical protein